jgi:hypothetical protein
LMVCTEALRWRNERRNLSMAFSTGVRAGFVAIDATTNLTTKVTATQRKKNCSLSLCDPVVKKSPAYLAFALG